MRRPRLRQSKPDPSAPPEVVKEEESLRLRALLRAVRYAEEGADVVVLRLSDLSDANRRRLVLPICEKNESAPPRRSPFAQRGKR